MVYLYLLATLLFVFGIKRLTTVRTCAQGNRLSELGMLVAVISVLLISDSVNWTVVIAGMAVGGAVGLFLAKKTPTTQMPELVAALNGFGGVASALVAIGDVLTNPILNGSALSIFSIGLVPAIATPIAILIGMVTLTGSFVAYGKLSGKNFSHPLSGGARHVLHALLVLVAITVSVWMVTAESSSSMTTAMLLLAAIAAVLGLSLIHI